MHPNAEKVTKDRRGRKHLVRNDLRMGNGSDFIANETMPTHTDTHTHMITTKDAFAIGGTGNLKYPLIHCRSMIFYDHQTP